MGTSRHVRRLAAIACAATLLTVPGCRLGGWSDEAIASRLGAPMRVRTEAGRVTGELILVRDDGVVLYANGRLLLSPWTAMRELHDDRSGELHVRDGRAPDSRHREALRRISRYPYGLADAQMQALLASMAQTELDILR